MGSGGRKTSEEPIGETKGRAGHCNMSTSEPCADFTGTEASPEVDHQSKSSGTTQRSRTAVTASIHTLPELHGEQGSALGDGAMLRRPGRQAHKQTLLG